MKNINEVMANLIKLKSVYEIRKVSSKTILIVTNRAINDQTFVDIINELSGYRWELCSKPGDSDFYNLTQTFIRVLTPEILETKGPKFINDDYLFDKND